MATNLEQLMLTALSYSDLRSHTLKDRIELKDGHYQALVKMLDSPNLGLNSTTQEKEKATNVAITKAKEVLKNWQVLTTTKFDTKDENDEENGFYAVAYKNIVTGEVVVSYRGSHPLDSISDENLAGKTAAEPSLLIERFIDDWQAKAMNAWISPSMVEKLCRCTMVT